MLDIFLKFIDAIFPPHEYLKKLNAETLQNFSRHYSQHKFKNFIVLSDYTNSFIKSAITANKFHDYEKASSLLATLVECWLKTQISRKIIFVPIPLSTARQNSRGYNQVTRVLEKINLQDSTISNLLSRNIDTKPQTTLNRADRLINLENAFSFNENKQIDYTNKRVVIVDDVVTTGATMLSAHKILREHLPNDCEIICLVFAH